MRDIVKGAAYEKRLKHPAFLGVDFVRAIEAKSSMDDFELIFSRPFRSANGGNHRDCTFGAVYRCLLDGRFRGQT
jgi:hypothetical protein